MTTTTKKLYRPAVISVDLRGRLVANYRQVFSSDQVMLEIEAARILRKALKSGREPVKNKI